METIANLSRHPAHVSVDARDVIVGQTARCIAKLSVPAVKDRDNPPYPRFSKYPNQTLKRRAHTW
jgi:hypothetical protein